MYNVRRKNSTNDLKRFQTVTAVKYISIINLLLILVLLKLSDRQKWSLLFSKHKNDRVKSILSVLLKHLLQLKNQNL